MPVSKVVLDAERCVVDLPDGRWKITDILVCGLFAFPLGVSHPAQVEAEPVPCSYDDVAYKLHPMVDRMVRNEIERNRRLG